MSPEVEAYRGGLSLEMRPLIEALRKIVLGSAPGLEETIKWNAPSYAVGGEDRITLGLERKGGVRLVLHRGPRSPATADLSTVDVEGIATWPAPDRGVIKLRCLDDVHASSAKVGALCRRWVEATTQDGVASH